MLRLSKQVESQDFAHEAHNYTLKFLFCLFEPIIGDLNV